MKKRNKRKVSFSKKQHTRKFGKRNQQRFQKKSRSKKHRGGKGIFDLTSAIDWKRDDRLNIMEEIQKLYLGYALVKKNLFGVYTNRRQVMVVIGRNKSTKKAMLVIIKCKYDTGCSDKSNIKVHEIQKLTDNKDGSFDYTTPTGLFTSSSYNISLKQALDNEKDLKDDNLMNAERFTHDLELMAKINDFDKIHGLIKQIRAKQDAILKQILDKTPLNASQQI